jgi:hypothetical protein
MKPVRSDVEKQAGAEFGGWTGRNSGRARAREESTPDLMLSILARIAHPLVELCQDQPRGRTYFDVPP